jgi:hypothetical protein
VRVTIIDPVRQDVQYWEIHPPIKGAVANVVGGHFKLALRIIRDDLLYVNPYDTSSKGFSVRGRSFSGPGLIMGRIDEQGRYSPSKVPVWEISAVVQFHS